MESQQLGLVYIDLVRQTVEEYLHINIKYGNCVIHVLHMFW